jgi:hypothetical protein
MSADEVAALRAEVEHLRAAWTRADEDANEALRALADERAAHVEALREEWEMSEKKIRRPGRLACPVCKKETDGQPEYSEGSRTFQAFICDTAACPVGSFRVEWRTMLTQSFSAVMT